MTRKDTCADSTPKLDRRIVKTKRAIKEAFHRLIAEQGFGTFSITALAQEADIDRKTFYLHYASIDDLVQEEAVDLVNRITCALSQPHDELTTARPLNTGAVLRELAQLVEDDCTLYQRLFSSMSVEQMVRALHGPVMDEARDEGWLDAVPDERALSYLVDFYIAGTLTAFRSWLLEDEPRSIDELVSALSLLELANAR